MQVNYKDLNPGDKFVFLEYNLGNFEHTKIDDLNFLHHDGGVYLISEYKDCDTVYVIKFLSETNGGIKKSFCDLKIGDKFQFVGYGQVEKVALKITAENYQYYRDPPIDGYLPSQDLTNHVWHLNKYQNNELVIIFGGKHNCLMEFLYGT